MVLSWHPCQLSCQAQASIREGSATSFLASFGFLVTKLARCRQAAGGVLSRQQGVCGWCAHSAVPILVRDAT